MMFRPMGVCNRAANLVEAVQNYEAEKCPYKKTNADRIRAMSDEELAEIISSNTLTGACNDFGIPHKKCRHNCKECVLTWLQQPAKESE